MSRIGRLGASQIYNYATGKNIPRVDEGQALEGYQLTNEKPFTNKLNTAPFLVKFNFYDMSNSLSNKEFYDRAQKRYNKTEYQMKVGKRSEGNRYQDAKDKPFIEFAQMAGNTFVGEAPNLETLPEYQQRKLKNTLPNEVIEETPFDIAQQIVQKFDHEPTDKQKIQIANKNPIEFIDKKLYEIEAYPSQEAGRVDGGSNIKIDFKKEMGHPTNIVDERQAIEIDKQAETRINYFQRAANKGRQIIGLYKEKPVAEQLKETIKNVDYLNSSMYDQMKGIKEYKDKLGVSQLPKKPKRILNVAPLKPANKEREIFDKTFGKIKKPKFGKLNIKKNPAEY